MPLTWVCLKVLFELCWSSLLKTEGCSFLTLINKLKCPASHYGHLLIVTNCYFREQEMWGQITTREKLRPKLFNPVGYGAGSLSLRFVFCICYSIMFRMIYECKCWLKIPEIPKSLWLLFSITSRLCHTFTLVSEDLKALFLYFKTTQFLHKNLTPTFHTDF